MPSKLKALLVHFAAVLQKQSLQNTADLSQLLLDYSHYVIIPDLYFVHITKYTRQVMIFCSLQIVCKE